MRKIIVIFLVVLLSGCASGISNKQKLEFEAYKTRGLAIEEKSPAAGAAFGLLPGGGSFYGREYGLGVVNLLFWPLSILWDPVSGMHASERINYIETRESVAKLRIKEMDYLNQRRMSGFVDDYTYNMELVNISQKYDIDPISMPVSYIQRTRPQTKVNQNETYRDQKLSELQSENLPYEEYQRRYKKIMEN